MLSTRDSPYTVEFQWFALQVGATSMFQYRLDMFWFGLCAPTLMPLMLKHKFCSEASWFAA
jgi:hypothetical protein